jgi:leucyl-tRNA synthetase
MSKAYTPKEIEPKWQAKWEADGLYHADIDESKPKHYALTMLPYPSGDLHIGHWYAMTPSDARARYMRMKGYNVMFPMGFDAFGLPAENAAIKSGIHPMVRTRDNIEKMRGQLRSMGAMFDWRREMVSCEPDYYKWTEWFFIQLYKNGLAYRKKSPVDFCPNCNTTLAREQVWGDDRHCERCNTPVIKKDLEQWFFKTTKYADEMLRYEGIDWPERVKTLQTNWIGKSEGAEVYFEIDRDSIRDTSILDNSEAEASNNEYRITVFTTRPDTLWGATFMVFSPEHPLVDKITSPEQKAAIQAYKTQAARQTDIEREATDKEKTGVFTGGYAINPVNGAKIPIWIADYVLMSYGTGAIMAVPAHDERDFAFARKFELPIVPVIQPEGEPLLDGATMEVAYSGGGLMINSAQFNGTSVNDKKGKDNPGIIAVAKWLEEKGIGKLAVTYKLRDWLISRQRYWGSPIPMIYCEKDGWNPVPEDQLPVTLPEDVEWKPTGESPLKLHPTWKNTDLPGLRRPGDPRNRHDGHVYVLVVVSPGLSLALAQGRAVRRERVQLLDAGRYLHRRHRARQHAPDVHAFLPQGPARRRHHRRPRANDPTAQPGHGAGRGQREDVEEPRQRGRAGCAGGLLRGRHRARLPDVLRALGYGRALGQPGHRGFGPLGTARLDAVHRRGGTRFALPRNLARLAKDGSPDPAAGDA